MRFAAVVWARITSVCPVTLGCMTELAETWCVVQRDAHLLYKVR